MFIMHMADTFSVGDRAEVRINGRPVTLYWRDGDTLVINDTDVRQILAIDTGVDGHGRPIRSFTCGDAEAPAGV